LNGLPLAEVICLRCGHGEGRDDLQGRLLQANPRWLEIAADALPDGEYDLPVELVAGFNVVGCGPCGGALKPDVVFFGGNVPEATLAAAWELFDRGEALLVVGSSLTVLSGFRFVRRARELGLPIAVSERLYGWLSYTLSWNLRAFGGGVIGPSDWDQRHVLNLVLGYRLGRYSVGGRAHYNTGRPVLVGGDFQPLPPFYQIDLRADRRFVFNRFSMEVYLELVNATLDREVVSLQTTGIGPPVQNSYLIVLPSIGVHAEF
jgi:hypothetical protein